MYITIRGQYDNMQGSLDTVNKRRKTLPLFTMSTQEPQWHYRLPWIFREYQQKCQHLLQSSIFGPRIILHHCIGKSCNLLGSSCKPSCVFS